MKKSYNTPETQMHVMEVQDGFLLSGSTSDGDANPDIPQEIPGQNSDPLQFSWY